jgi:arginase
MEVEKQTVRHQTGSHGRSTELKPFLRHADSCRLLSIAVNKPAREGKFTLTVGGDHSIAIGSISGILRAQPETRVIWVDAHADINTPETTETGNIHGMPVAYLMGIVNSPCFEWLKTGSEELGGAPVKLLPQRIAYIGLRDVDKGELEILRQFNITTFTMIDVDRLGIQEVIKRAVEAVDPEGGSPLHLSFDVDGLDASVAASTGTPVVGGLSYREGRYICEYLGATNREEGLTAALSERPRPGKMPVLSGKQEAFLVALACSTPPEGRRRWTMQLLAERLIELQQVGTLSHDTVRRVLKKTTLSPGNTNAGVSPA